MRLAPGRALLVRASIEALNGTAGAAGSMYAPSMPRRFVEALGKAIGVIGASEIGDKTFFIAAVMAMRNSRWTVSRRRCERVVVALRRLPRMQAVPSGSRPPCLARRRRASRACCTARSLPARWARWLP